MGPGMHVEMVYPTRTISAETYNAAMFSDPYVTFAENVLAEEPEILFRSVQVGQKGQTRLPRDAEQAGNGFDLA